MRDNDGLMTEDEFTALSLKVDNTCSEYDIQTFWRMTNPEQKEGIDYYDLQIFFRYIYELNWTY